jgi:GntR family transcriptional repressor for pyruvate dehydrogenase complex
VTESPANRDPEASRAVLADLFSQAAAVRSSEHIAVQIQDAISRGHIRSGETLPNERNLAAMFAVSRSSVREAMRLLEGAGVIEVRRGAGGGAFVIEPGADRVASALQALLRFREITAVELAEFRVSFEGETAYWAAERATAEDIQGLRSLAADFTNKVAAAETEWASLVAIDVRFHEAVAEASKNAIRHAIMLSIHSALYEASLAIDDRTDLPTREQSAAQLRSIVAAIEAGEGEKARELMRQHVGAASRGAVAAHLRKLASEGPTATKRRANRSRRSAGQP